VFRRPSKRHLRRKGAGVWGWNHQARVVAYGRVRLALPNSCEGIPKKNRSHTGKPLVSQQMMDSRWGFRESGARVPSVRECFVLIQSKIYSASCR
jgi:hypothetical protein